MEQKCGTALKTIIARFQEMKENPMAVLEDGVNANRVEKALKSVGVALRDANGEFRNLDEVFNELGGKWQDLTRNQKAYIATMAAGSRQQSRFMAIMNDYDRTLELINMSTNSAGEANKQYAIYTDSVEAAQNRLNNSLEAFYSKLTNSDAIKAFYKALSWVVDSATALGPILSGLIALITVLGIRYAFSTIEIQKNTIAQVLSNQANKNALTGLPKLIFGLVERIFFTKALTAAEIDGTAAATAFNVATGGILLVAGLVIGAIAMIATTYKSAGDRALESAQNQKEASEQAKLEANNLGSLIERYKILNTKIDLTNSEREELAAIKREIMAISPQLVESIDKEGNIRLKSIETLEKELAIRKQLAMFEARKTLQATAEAGEKNTWESQYNEEEKKQLAAAKDYAEELKEIGLGIMGAGNMTGAPVLFEQFFEQIDTVVDQVKNGTKDVKTAKEELLKTLNFDDVRENITGNFDYKVSGAGAAGMFGDAVSKITALTGQTNSKLENQLYKELMLTEGDVSIEESVNKYIEGLTGGSSKNIEDIIKNKQVEINNLIEGAINGTSLFAMEKYNTEKNKVQGYMTDYIQGMFEWKKSTNAPGFEYSDIVTNSINAMSNEVFKILEKEAVKIDETTGYAFADINKNGETSYEEIVDYINNNAIQKSELLYNELMSFAQDDIPQAVKNTQKELTNLIAKGATQGEISNVKQKLAQQIRDMFPKDSEIADMVVKSNANDDVYQERVDQIARLFYPEGAIEGARQEQAEDFFGKFTSEMGDFLVGLIDTGDADLINAAKTVLSTANEEQAKVLNEAFAKIDLTSPSSIESFKEILRTTFGTSLTEEQISNMFVNADIYLELFLKKTTETFTKIKTLSEDLKKSLSGTIEIGDIEKLTDQYGEGAVQKTGAGYSLSTETLVAKQRQFNNELLQTQFDTIAEINIEIENLAKKEGSLTVEDTKRLKNLEKQKILTEQIVADIEHIDLMEGAIINNQSVLNGVAALNNLTSSLKNLSSTYQQVKEGGMSLFDTIEAIANNPALVGTLKEQDGLMRLNASSMRAMAEQKKQETIVFLNSELAKVEAALGFVETQLDLTKVQTEAEAEASKEAITQMGSETSAKVEAVNTDILAEQGGVDAMQVSMDADAERTEQFLINAKARLDAIKTVAGAEGKTVSGSIDISGFSKGTINTEVKQLTNEDYATILANRYGIPIGTNGALDPKVLNKIKNRLLNEKGSLQGLISEITKLTTDQMLSEIAGGDKKDKGGDKKDKGGKKDSFEAFMAEFDKYYNYLKKLEKLANEISEIDARISLESTGGAEDIRLIKEKSEAIKQETGVLEKFIKVQKADLKSKRESMEIAYGDYINFDAEGNLRVRWDLINATKINSEADQKWLDGLNEAISSYDDLNSSMTENNLKLLENAALLEEVANQMEDQTIDLRQRLYDALVEAGQKEIDATKEKYDKMKEAESDYLSAVKNAIDKERQMRDDSNKEEDLAQKKRKLAVLERDTSGMYSQETEKLRGEINKDEQALRDQAVDRQYEALQKQYELQQEQRDLEVKSLEEQMATRQENGYYWSMVDQTIAAGPQAMINLLQSTDAYQKMDPFAQGKEGETIKNDVAAIAEIFRQGQTKAGEGASVTDIINAGIEEVTNPETTTPTVEPPTTTPTTPPSGGATPYPGTAVRYGSKGKMVKIVQKSLNDAISAGLKVDGSFGKATLAAVKTFQKKKRLSVDGIVGPKTWPKLVTKYEKGGLVDFTGPAWVDGSKQKPESFLDAYQTKMFAHLAEVLENRKATIDGAMKEMVNNIRIGDIIVNLQNPTTANPTELSKLIRKEILNTYQNRITTSIQKSR